MKFLFLILLTLVACSNKSPAKHNHKLSEYEIEALNLNQKFTKEITKYGECWVDEYKIPYEAFFIKSKIVITPANILLSKDKDVFLIGQVNPECEELFENSKKCDYRIRMVKEKDLHVFFSKNSKKVDCPNGLTVKSILLEKSTPEEKSIFDFSKILKQ